jgi:hypothetical protein
MNYRKTISLLLFLGQSLLLTSVHAGECDLYKKKELDEIRNAEKNEFESVIFVKAFDGLVLLPNRYGIFIEKSSLTSFVSPPVLTYLSNKKESLKKKFGCFSGNVTFGNYVEYLKADNRRRGESGWPKLLKKFQYKGFTVEKRIVAIENADVQVTMYLVHNDKTFMQVSDTNDELWKAIIDSSEGYKGTNI